MALELLFSLAERERKRFCRMFVIKAKNPFGSVEFFLWGFPEFNGQINTSSCLKFIDSKYRRLNGRSSVFLEIHGTVNYYMLFIPARVRSLTKLLFSVIFIFIRRIEFLTKRIKILSSRTK